VCFFRGLASSGQLGTWRIVVCNVFDFAAVSGGGDWAISSGAEVGTGCQIVSRRELMFAAIVARADIYHNSCCNLYAMSEIRQPPAGSQRNTSLLGGAIAAQQWRIRTLVTNNILTQERAYARCEARRGIVSESILWSKREAPGGT
jgi:hypothetical protein